MEAEKKTPMDTLKRIGLSLYGCVLVAAMVWGSLVLIRNLLRPLFK